MSPARAALLAAAGWGGAALTARVLAAHPPAALAQHFFQPLPVIDSCGSWGLQFVALSIVCAVWSSLLALSAVDAVERDGRRSDARAFAAAFGLLLAAVLAWPAVFSSDVYAYAAFGERVLGAPSGPIWSAAHWQWGPSLPPDNYGPGFDAFAAALVLLGHRETLPVLWGFRLAACAALALSVAFFFGASAGRDPRERAAATVALALNPILLWSAAEGHNDLLAIAVVVGGWALARRAPSAGGLIAALAGAIKLPALAAAFAIAAVRRAAPQRFRWGVAAGTAIALAACVPLTLATFGRMQHPSPAPSFPMLYPWYFTWLIPFAAYDRRTRKATLAISAAALLAYVPDAYGSSSIALRAGISGVLLTVAAFAAFRALRRP